MAQRSNDERILNIATALEELNDEVVYVGGSVAQYYSKDAASHKLQTTFDVDCVIDISTYDEYNEFQERLYRKKFRNDHSEGAPVCRFVFNDEKVDVMPKVYIPLTGDSNSWYPDGIKHRISHDIGKGRRIYIFPVSFYLASKLEALRSRGGEDYRGAKDFEDIVYVLNSCSDLVKQIQSIDDEKVKSFLKTEFSALIERMNIREEIESSLTEDERTEYVLSRMGEISKL